MTNASIDDLLSTLASSNSTDVPPEQLALAYATIQAYMQTKIIGLSLGLLGTYAVLALLCAALVVYLRRNRGGARRGDNNAARKVLLPAFEPLLWILGGTASAYCVYLVIALSLAFYPTRMPSVHIECFYAGRQFVLLLVVVFMLQMSVTIPALVRSVAITLALATSTLPLAWYMETHRAVADASRANTYYYVQVGSHSLVQLLYVYVLVWPPSRASKSALRCYCVFALAQHGIDFACITALWHLRLDLGFRLAFASLAVNALCPLFVWTVLTADTAHWRGLGERACALHASFRARADVLEHVSSGGLHVLVELHRKCVIDFAHLELCARIGVGASAVVYTGVLRSRTPVAVKVYTPTRVTEDTVAAFSHEAALCSALHHPNIVHFYGLCVAPPTICLVSELCNGSLDVVTYTLAQRRRQQQQQVDYDLSAYDHDQVLLLVNLNYMLDTARAVAYLHSFTPAFVHRDIKPTNFVVDANGTVKLTDFGDSRFLPKSSASGIGSTSAGTTTASDAVHSSGNDDVVSECVNSSSSSATGCADFGTNIGTGVGSCRRGSQQMRSPTVPLSPSYMNYETAMRNGARANSVTIGPAESGPLLSHTTRGAGTATGIIPATNAPTPQMTVKGTVDYMAPEMIQGRAGLASYGEAADVYSLAVTMWDVLHPATDKYPRARRNHLHVLASVVAGDRPALDAALHPMLRDLLVRGWHEDPWRRPTARAVVQTLERIQKNVAVTLACKLQHTLSGDEDANHNSYEWPQRVNTSGSIIRGIDTAPCNSTVDRDNRAAVTETRSTVCINVGDNRGAPNGTNGRTNSDSNNTRSDRAQTAAKLPPPLSAADSAALAIVSGDTLVHQFVDRYAVAASSEAVRLGSMLMDAGLLHHVKHARAFECSCDALYFFDTDRLRRCPSVAMPESHEQQQVSGDEGGAWTKIDRAIARADPSTRLLCAARAVKRHNALASFEHSEPSAVESALGAIVGRSARRDSSDDDDDSAAADSCKCACRQLGQRFVRQQRSVKRLFRRKFALAHSHAHEPIPEHSVLTANLLDGSQYFGCRVSLSESGHDDSDSDDDVVVRVGVDMDIVCDPTASDGSRRACDDRLSSDAFLDVAAQDRVLV